MVVLGIEGTTQEGCKMKIGDLVKSTRFVAKPGVGIIIGSYSLDKRDITYSILWGDGKQGWQTPRQLELVGEST